MTTYVQLRTDIADWMAREDLTSKIPTFVDLAEAAIRRDVRVRDMEASTDLTLSAQSVSLPTDFIEARRLYLDNTSSRELDYLTPERFYDSAVYALSGNPRAYTIEGNNIIFAPAPSGSPTAKLLYLSAYDALSGDADTNWIMTNAYDVYLFGSLFHAAVYTEDDSKAQKYGELYRVSVREINKQDNLSRFSGSHLIRTGKTTP